MAPIEYIPMYQAYYRASGLGEFPLCAPTDTPWTPLRKPLGQCRVALVCSAGISCKDQPPFRRLGHDDFGVREIPKCARPDDLVINYDFIDHSDADKDINCLFPLARLRDLEDEGAIGALCGVAFSMGIGRWRHPDTLERLQGEVAHELARRCREQEADVALLVPG